MKNFWFISLMITLFVFVALLGTYSFGIISLKTQEEKDLFVIFLLICEIAALISILGLSFPKFLLRR
ncbi:MAG: hypothetical protein PHC89_00735 [Candidatus Pacebacteria bacterium]|nr:hypothetical protein [Candidatus Paceibacterota bacterium]